MANIIYAYINNKIIAEKEYEFYLCFDSKLEEYENPMILCHLYDPQFFLEYYLPEISLSPMNVENNVKSSLLVDKHLLSDAGKRIRKFKMKFPSHLAGGTFQLNFVLQKMKGNILEAPKIVESTDSLQKFIINAVSPQPLVPIGFPVQNNCFSVDVTIEHPSGPSFKDLYWGENDEIKYGVKSPSRSKTTVHQNEYLHAHLHTEGMYGMPITVFLGNDRLDTHILDNTLDVSYNSKIFFNKRLNQIFFRIRDVTLPNSTLLCNHSFKITPDLTFDSTKALNIKGAATSASNVSNDPKTDDWEKCSDSLCRVDFRPTRNYDGSFGFSWFRVDDTKDHYILNDRSFLEKLGYHYETYNAGENGPKIVDQDPNSCDGDFYKDDEMIKKHINDYQRIIMPLMLDGDDMDSPKSVLSGKYLVPQMTIRKGKSAELAMYIKSKSMPEKFSFEFSNPAADGYLTVNKKDWDSIKTGDTLKIECKKEFSKSVNLYLYGYSQKDDEGSKELCGSIRILPNDIMHQRNVDLLILDVHLLTSQNGNLTIVEGNSNPGIKEDKLHEFFNQSYFNLHVFNKIIDLYDPYDPYVKSYYQDKKNKNILPIDIFKNLFIADSSPYHYDLDYNKGGKLAELMDNIINYIPDINRNCYKIIQIPWKTTKKEIKNGVLKYKQINGFSIKGRRLTFCFEGCNDSTPTHELGHAFGLPHTFTGCTSRAKYVYEYTMTDNFMDYSHHIGIDRQSFYYWQWKTMNALME